MPATAAVIKDSGASTTRNVIVDFSDDDGFINRAHVRLSAGIDAQAWGDAVAPRRSTNAHRKEMERAVEQCAAGTPPGDVVRTRITLPRLWEVVTRRLHNGPRNGLDLDTMKGLAQHVVARATPAIVADLNNVRTSQEVNALKVEWQALLDADVTDFDEVEE